VVPLSAASTALPSAAATTIVNSKYRPIADIIFGDTGTQTVMRYSRSASATIAGPSASGLRTATGRRDVATRTAVGNQNEWLQVGAGHDAGRGHVGPARKSNQRAVVTRRCAVGCDVGSRSRATHGKRSNSRVTNSACDRSTLWTDYRTKQTIAQIKI
jgi:hypothetical protein